MVLVHLVKSPKVIAMSKKPKEPSLFIKEKSLDEIKYLGVGFFEWLAVLGAFCVILSAIIKKF